MKKSCFVFAILFFFYQLPAQVEYKDSTQYYSFEINYWFNLHHFLWMESFTNVHQDSTLIEGGFAKEAKLALNQAIDYYKKELLDQDLRSSDYMTSFKQWITGKEVQLEQIPPEFEEQMVVLKNVSNVYKTHFWPIHKKACIKVVEDNIKIIRQTEEKFVDSITYLTRQFWQLEKLKVDVTYVAKSSAWNLRNRPYTTIFPTHVVMNAIGDNEVPGNWIELLYHESAHHLILSRSYFIGGTVKDVVETMKVKPPRSLGHSYLFYLTGEVTKGLLNDLGIPYEKTYMQRHKVFLSYHKSLEKYLQEYMDRKITLADATQKIIVDLSNKKK